MPPLPILLLIVVLAGCGGKSNSKTGNEAQLASAHQLEARGETRSAIIALKNLIQQAPADAEARLALGRLYLDTGDLPSADKELRRALALGKHAAQVMPWLGKAMLLQGQFLPMLEQIEADAQQPALMALRGHALLGLQRNDEAARLFEQILVRHPGHPAALTGQARMALQSGNPAAALALTERALGQSPANVDAWRLKGDLLRLQQRNPEALAAYRQALTLHPSLVQAHVDMASLHIQAAQFDQARAELALARRAAPGSLMLIYTQALLDFRANKLSAARDQLQLVLRAAPEHAPSHLLMGVILRRLGAPQQAAQHLRTFLAANPAQAYASKLLASVLMNTGDAQGALTLLQPLLAQHAQDVEMLALAGEVHLRLRHFEQAARYFEQASALAPDTPMLRTATAMSHLGLGDNSRAVAELEQAATLDEKSSRTGTLLVLTHLRNRHYDKALEAVQRMAAHQADNPMVHNLKGGVLLLQRDLAGARASFEQALKFDPVFLPALDNLTQLDLQEKNPEQARKRLENALAQEQGNTGVMAALASLAATRKQPAQALSWLERAQQAHPEDVDASLRLAGFYVRNDAAPKALLLLQKLAPTQPSHLPLQMQLAELQARHGKLEDALATWSKVAASHPNSAGTQLRLAELRTTSGDLDGARQAIDKALLLAPAMPQAQVAMVRLLIRQQAWQPAVQFARQLQATGQQGKPDAAQALGYKLEAEVLQAQQQSAPALVLYHKAYALQPGAPMLIPLYSALVQAGKRQQAHQHMQQWLAAHENDRGTRLFYANSLLAEKDFPASSAQFERLLQHSPDQPLLLNNLAWLYQQQQDGRALATAERAHQLAPRNAVVLDTLGWILAEQGKLEQAQSLLRQAAALAPHNTSIRDHLTLVQGKTVRRANDG
ncbi:MAG: XrtA/PEP-CTERM system TPR-repeat protein PrsT [Duganella sp.]